MEKDNCAIVKVLPTDMGTNQHAECMLKVGPSVTLPKVDMPMRMKFINMPNVPMWTVFDAAQSRYEYEATTAKIPKTKWQIQHVSPSGCIVCFLCALVCQ